MFKSTSSKNPFEQTEHIPNSQSLQFTGHYYKALPADRARRFLVSRLIILPISKHIEKDNKIVKIIVFNIL